MGTPREIRTDRELFARYLRRPTRRRLERVVRHFHARVWRIALRLTGNEDDAADIAQDLFLSLLLEPPRPDSVRSPAGYLAFRVLTLTRRMERSSRRRRQRENGAARRLLESAPSSTDVDAVREAIRQLPDPLRTTIELRYLGQFRNREIAEVIGVSERSVEEYLRQGREKLRARLGSVALGAVCLPADAQSDHIDVPRAALESALQVVRLGRALAPLSGTVPPASALSVTTLAGGIAMKKTVAGATFLILLAGWIAWSVSPEASREAVEQATAPGEGVEVAGTGKPAVEVETANDRESGTDAVTVVKPPAPPRAVFRARVAGRVIDEDGRPVSGARISACTSPLQIFPGREPELVGETESGDDGAFVLEDVRVDTVPLSVSATKDGFATAQTVAWASASRSEIDDVLLVLEPGATAIEGWVVDEQGEPIAGARVWPCAFTTAFGLRQFGMLAAGGAGSVTTDTAGRFRVDGMRSSNPVDLTVTHLDYRRAQIRYLVPGGPQLEIELASGLLFEGKVIDSSGSPVAGVRITLEEDAPSRWGAGVRNETTVSGEDGSFALRAVPEGTTWFLSVDPPLEYLVPPDDVIEIAAPVSNFVITLETGGWVEGTARVDGSGALLPGAQLTVFSGRSARTSETGADGTFRCAVEPGDVVVTPKIDRRGLHVPLEGGELTGTVEERGTFTGTVWFSRRDEPARAAAGPAAVTGRTVDAAGAPVVALVALSDEVDGSGFNGQQRSTQTDVDGRFAFASLPWLPVRLIAANPRRGLTAQRVIRDASEGAEILLELAPYPSTGVEGIVRREDGTPIPYAGVILSRGGHELDGAALCARADADGRFVVERLLPDTYYSFNPVAGTRQGPTEAKRTRVGERIEIELVVPDASAPLTGVVTDRQGLPLPDIRVAYEYQQDHDVREDFAMTDRAGRFEARVLPGRYFVRVDERGFGFWSTNVEAPANVEVVLTPTRTVTFVAVRADGLPVPWLRVFGAAQGPGAHHFLRSPDGAYAVEAQENETELRLEHTPAFEEKRIELRWPPRGPLDLGTLRLERKAEDGN